MKRLAVLILALVAALAPEAHAKASKGTLVVNIVGIPKGHVRSVLISDGRYPKATQFTKKGGGAQFVFKNVPPRVYEVFADLSFRFAKADAQYRRGDVALRVNDRNAPNVTGGQTTTYTVRYRRVPTPKPIKGATQVSVSNTYEEQFACAVIKAAVKCWSKYERPKTVITSGAKSVAAGGRHSCALMLDTSVRCWGTNDEGQLGNGRKGGSAKKPAVAIASGAAQVSAGGATSCALMLTGAVVCWGYLPLSEEDWGHAVPTPQVMIDADAKQVVAGTGAGRSCVLMVTGEVRCWGPFPVAAHSDRYFATPTSFVAGGVNALSGEDGLFCGIFGDGGVRCWRDVLTGGEDGTGGAFNLDPVIVDAPGAEQLTNGQQMRCFIAHGTVRCWGNHFQGMLGDGRGDDLWTDHPVQAIASGATQVSAGTSTACAIVRGSIKCWGGIVGDGTGVPALFPVDVG